MRGQFVRLRPSIDRRALDFFPVAGREHHGSSAISASDLSFWHWPSIPRHAAILPGFASRSGARSVAVEERVGLKGPAGDFFPVMRVLGVLALPGPDRKALDSLPVAVRERH